MLPEINTPKKPDNNTAGIISKYFPHRKETVKTANPKAELMAAMLPLNATSPNSSATIILMPMKAVKITTLVPLVTISLKKMRPNIALKKGAAANRSMALATEVTWIEYIAPA